MKDNMNLILNSIIKESGIFLNNDMQLNIVEKRVINNNLYSYSSIIDLSDDNMKYLVILSIEDKLLEELLNKFFKDGVEANEKDELLNDLVNETINTVVGLAMRNFSSEFENLELGLPLKLSKEDALKLLNKNISESLEIVTDKGSFICIVL